MMYVHRTHYEVQWLNPNRKVWWPETDEYLRPLAFPIPCAALSLLGKLVARYPKSPFRIQKEVTVPGPIGYAHQDAF